MKIARAYSLIAILGLLFCIQHIVLADSQERKVDTARPAATPLDREAAQDIVKLTLVDGDIRGRGLVVANLNYVQKEPFSGKITVSVDPPFAVRPQRKREGSTVYIGGGDSKSSGTVKLRFELDCIKSPKLGEGNVVARYKIYAAAPRVRGVEPEFGPALAEVSQAYTWRQVCGGNGRADSDPTPELDPDIGKTRDLVRHTPAENVIFPKLTPSRPGLVSQTGSDMSDHCVPNVRDQIAERMHDGEGLHDILAYRSGQHGAPSRENGGLYKTGRTGRDSWKHRQGVARYFSGDRNYFYISNSVTPKWTNAQKFAGVEVVSWGDNRNPGRLGSNVGGNRNQAPRADFSVVKYIQEDDRNHAGGIQVYGRFLVVPYFDEQDYIVLYDLADPERPAAIDELRSKENVQFGFAALTRLNNGQYMAIGGDSAIEVFVSNGTSPLSEWKSHSFYLPGSGFVQHAADVESIWGEVSMKYQGAQFITDCSGALFLALTRKTINAAGTYQNDWIDVWQVRVFPNHGLYTIELEKVNAKHMYCGGGGGSLWCNFTAGATVYIDPSTGNLLAYGVEHWNDGPKVNGIGSTKMKEFRQR